jgi:septal ring factor EnvC (AmiA/AmiB activator)
MIESSEVNDRTHRHLPAGLRLLTVLVSICLALAVLPVPTHAGDDASAKAAELKRLRTRISELKANLEATRGKHSQEQTILHKVEQKVGDAAEALRELEQEISHQQERLTSLETKRSNLRRTLEADRKLLARQVRASYVMGRQEDIKILLNQGDPTTVQRALVYYDYLNRMRATRIRATVNRLQQLQQVEESIRQQQERLQGLYVQQQQEKAKLEASRDARAKVLAALNSEILDKDKQLHDLVRDEQELQQVLNALEQALSDIPADHQVQQPFASLRGKLPWPAQGRLVARYGERRAAGNLRWRGVLIAASRGGEVRAISHGRVAFADWLRGYGLLIIIDHGNGFMSLYGHNQGLYKEVGEWVEPGDVIASVGDSGGQADSGLYFEIRRQGKPLDPARWCQSASGSLVSWRR